MGIWDNLFTYYSIIYRYFFKIAQVFCHNFLKMSTIHLIQSIADDKFGEETFDHLPKSINPGVLKTLRILRLFGEISFENLGDYDENVNSYLIRNNIRVEYGGEMTHGIEVMKKLSPKFKYESESEPVFSKVKITDDYYQIIDDSGVRHLKLKLHMDEELIDRVCKIAIINSDPGSVVEMQPDSHSAGDIFVGMIMVFDSTRIPISVVSADIGCGLTLLPIVENDKHMNVNEVEDMDKTKLNFLLASRKSLKRGNVSEKGEKISDLIYDALDFYDEETVGSWLDDMKDILVRTGLWRNAMNDINGTYKDLTVDQHACLRYIGRYSQTLGSSGNHFMELSEDDRGFMWAVVHSGSRRIGAMIYSCISSACKFMNNGLDMATGDLSIIYSKAYDSLNKFAKMNRAMCAIAVMKSLGIESRGSVLSKVLTDSWIFKEAVSKHIGVDEELKVSAQSLLSGLCHNGIKAFANKETKQVVYVLSKGAISVTTRASSSIVALKAGEGCVTFVLSNPENNWMEVTMQESSKLVEDGYEVNPDHKSWESSIIFAGHGAGRKQATAVTENEFKFEDLVEYFGERGVIANIAPGVLGDHPSGYKDAVDIVSKLPLDISTNHSFMKTLVSYKEGLPKGPKMSKRLAGYVKKNWIDMKDSEKICIDLVLIRKEIGDDIFKNFMEEKDKIGKDLDLIEFV